MVKLKSHRHIFAPPILVLVFCVLQQMPPACVDATTLLDRTHASRLRLLVLTDISSLTPGVKEPDDGQSLIRLLLYANEFDLEGFIASSNMIHGQIVRPDLIRQAIRAYGKVRPNLLKHDRRYPSAESLMEKVKGGQPIAGPRAPVFESIGPGKDTEASEWIIRIADKPDPRSLWITIWGGSADLAQALWKVRETRKPDETKHFVSTLRIRAIHDQDSTGEWIKTEFPDIYYLIQQNSMRGMYRGGDTSLSAREWVEANVNRDRGALGALYPNYDGGDIWGRVRGVKEGDTPSYLGLIPNGLNEPDHPELGGWGGRMEPDSGSRWRFYDAVDDYSGAITDRAPGMATVYRWRAACQADFAARLLWCVKNPREANHSPIVRFRGPRERRVKPGQTITLDARQTTDPDGNKLEFEWSIYPEIQGLNAASAFSNPHSPQTLFSVPANIRKIPILLTVRDSGIPSLTRYARIILRVDLYN